MMWGYMGWNGIGYATRIEGKIDADLYVSIMEDELQQTLEFWGKTTNDIVFQQDNDPKHTCKKAKDWFKNHHMEVLSWPAQSPDLNPIEHLWQHLKKRLNSYSSHPSGILELVERIQAEWKAIPASVCMDLVESMPRRVEAVIGAKGGYTKY